MLSNDLSSSDRLICFITTFQEKSLEDVIGPENTHRCRIHPHEAAIYSLEAEGENIDMFKAISKTELTLMVEETSDEQPEKKKEHSYVEFPVNFSKGDVAKVRLIAYRWEHYFHSISFNLSRSNLILGDLYYFHKFEIPLKTH